jgi:hypothetical protein
MGIKSILKPFNHMKSYTCYPGPGQDSTLLYRRFKTGFGYNVPKEAVKESTHSQPLQIFSARKEHTKPIGSTGMAKDKIKIEVIDEKLIVTA